MSTGELWADAGAGEPPSASSVARAAKSPRPRPRADPRAVITSLLPVLVRLGFGAAALPLHGEILVRVIDRVEQPVHFLLVEVGRRSRLGWLRLRRRLGRGLLRLGCRRLRGRV